MPDIPFRGLSLFDAGSSPGYGPLDGGDGSHGAVLHTPPRTGQTDDDDQADSMNLKIFRWMRMILSNNVYISYGF